MVRTRSAAHGGLSVTIDDPRLLPSHLVPRSLGGPSNYTVYGLDEIDLSNGLQAAVREDLRRGYAMIEPSRIMPIEEYEALVEATRAKWGVILIP